MTWTFEQRLGPRPCEACGAGEECDCYDRATCSEAGKVGHWSCGWCMVHDDARFQCGCEFVITENGKEEACGRQR